MSLDVDTAILASLDFPHDPTCDAGVAVGDRCGDPAWAVIAGRCRTCKGAGRIYVCRECWDCWEAHGVECACGAVWPLGKTCRIVRVIA